MLMRFYLIALIGLLAMCAFGQTSNMVTYLGNSGKETLWDVLPLSDGTFLVSGTSDDLNWVASSVPKVLMSLSGVNNGQGTGKTGFILHLSADMTVILRVLHFADGAVEDIRYLRSTNLPGQPTGDIYFSGRNDDTKANNGGYYIAKLNNNFINGVPTGVSWATARWAEGYPKDYQPWDVRSDGKVVYISGQSHAYDWGIIEVIDASGQRCVMPNWRTHWKVAGGEYYGIAADFSGGIAALSYSGIVLKKWGRCDLRSWSQTDFDLWQNDENGGTKKGLWPLDAFFNGPCTPGNVVANGPGYTGYNTSGTPVHGGSSIVIDRRDNALYIGMNIKTVLPDGNPDFEPMVIAMDSTGGLKWWSRLYHEVNPAGDTMLSTPDQYIDALAIDYSQPLDSACLVVNARCHGNNVENLWEGNTIAANAQANGFKNGFSGTSGNIHISWLGKLTCSGGTLRASTYVAEYAEGTGSLGGPHPDPNLDGWPNPNGGWPNLNTTRLAKNSLEVGPNGEVCIVGQGRRTITTAEAHQKMVNPAYGGKSCWNAFVRVYAPDLSVPLYSSLIVGAWDTLTEAGGGNTELLGIARTPNGVIAVGRHTQTNGIADGNPIPVIGVPAWGSNQPSNESAIFAYLTSSHLQPDCTLVPPNITASVSTVCANGLVTYSVPPVENVTYLWEVSGGTILSGQGTPEIVVQWGSAGAGIVNITLTEN